MRKSKGCVTTRDVAADNSSHSLRTLFWIEESCISNCTASCIKIMNIFSKILTRFEFSEPTFKNVQNFQILSKVCNCGWLLLHSACQKDTYFNFKKEIDFHASNYLRGGLHDASKPPRLLSRLWHRWITLQFSMTNGWNFFLVDFFKSQTLSFAVPLNRTINVVKV